MSQQSFFDDDTHDSLVSRIESLGEHSTPKWGQMNCAQMLCHCAEVQEVINGRELKNTPFIARVFKGYIKKMVVGDKPYPHDTRTHPQYVVKKRVDLEGAKIRLLSSLAAFHSGGAVSGTHTLFGIMTGAERGKACFKHLDHHLTQFDA